MVQKSRRSSHDSTMGWATSSRVSCSSLSTIQTYGNMSSRSSSSNSRNSANGIMFSFQVSRGATRNCFRNLPSVMAKSAKVSGSSISFSAPFSWYLIV